ncbi:unnamed protein product [Sphacelaria rigidula]
MPVQHEYQGFFPLSGRAVIYIRWCAHHASGRNATGFPKVMHYCCTPVKNLRMCESLHPDDLPVQLTTLLGRKDYGSDAYQMLLPLTFAAKDLSFRASGHGMQLRI